MPYLPDNEYRCRLDRVQRLLREQDLDLALGMRSPRMAPSR